MERQTDIELVNAARNGDKRAFGHLVERYQSMAYGVALRMVGHEEVARDLAQEAILQAYLSLERLRQPSRFGSWLHGIVLNVCRGYFRDQKIDFTSLESLAGGLRYDDPLFNAQGIDPLEVVEARERQRMMLAAVEGLSDKNRTAVLLFYYEQLSVREIAALLEISVSAVKSRLYRSRQRLKHSLAALCPGGQITEFVTERNATMYKVTIADIVVNVQTGHHIVVLVNEEKSHALPIWIGPFEANAILLVLKEVSTARPITYDFLANILKTMATELEEVRIETLKNETFYAVAKLHSGDRVQEVDTRPSDALALALRTGTPIYVAEDVMATAGHPIPSETQEKPAIDNWYYSPLREVKTDFPAEELEKLPPPLGRFVSFGPETQKKPAQENQPTDEEEAQRKAQQARDRQELVAFVFGER